MDANHPDTEVCQVLQQATVNLPPKSVTGGSHVEKTADALKSLTLGDLDNPKAEAASNVFDLLTRGSLRAVQKSTEFRPVTKKDTARTANGSIVLDDEDFIESASQVSGPVSCGLNVYIC